jgi:hypothetical protein
MSNSRNRTPVGHSAVPADALTGTSKGDSTDIDQGHLDKSIGLGLDMSLEELRDSLNATVSQSMDDPHLKQFFADAAFMEEQVLVRIAPSSSKDDPKIVEVWNDGKPQRMIRGEWTIVRRKYVEVLARAKPFGVTTPETIDANGDRTTRIDTHNGSMYPFEMRDRNPIGQAWLARVLQEV